MTRISLFIILLGLLSLVGCNQEEELSVIDQNETNVNILKNIAKESGWSVWEEAVSGTRSIPLTESEIDRFRSELGEYDAYPGLKEKRPVQVVPMGNHYSWTLPFAFPETRTESGSLYGTATYNHVSFEVGVRYDLENGMVSYAFAGAGDAIWDKDRVIVHRFTSVYDKCKWGGQKIDVVIYVNYLEEHYSKNEDIGPTNAGNSPEGPAYGVGPYYTKREYIVVSGTFDIGAGTSNLTATWQSDGSVPPIID